MGKVVKRIVNRIIAALITLIPFVIMHILTITVFKGVYVFEWALENHYAYLWIIIPLVTLFDLKWGAVLSASNIACMIFGQVYGEYVHNKNVAMITSDITVEQVYYLLYLKGVFYWIDSLLLIAIAYGIFRIVRHIVIKHKKKKELCNFDKVL